MSYWTFDRDTIKGETVKDVLGENDATLVGNPKKVAGYVNGGLELDGNGDYVSLPNVGNFGSKIGEYTFEAWIKTTEKKRWSAIYRVIEQGCATWDNGTGIVINGKFDLRVGDEIVADQDVILIERSHIRKNGCVGGSSSRTFPISDGEWHQIVYTTQPMTKEDQKIFRQFRERNVHEGV